MKNSSQIIIGIDPGTTVTGYGIIRVDGSSYKAIDYGCIRPPPKNKLSDRYLIIFESVEELLTLHKPDILVVETQYVHKNVQSAIKLGMARGIVILAAKRKGLPVFEYAPTRAKKAVVGTGSASKQQVQRMMQSLLNLAAPPPEDASDALSLAFCHANSAKWTSVESLEI
jgi:crossover junction endodeoxyribonuclease RuvC